MRIPILLPILLLISINIGCSGSSKKKEINKTLRELLQVNHNKNIILVRIQVYDCINCHIPVQQFFSSKSDAKMFIFAVLPGVRKKELQGILDKLFLQNNNVTIINDNNIYEKTDSIVTKNGINITTSYIAIIGMNDELLFSKEFKQIKNLNDFKIEINAYLN